MEQNITRRNTTIYINDANNTVGNSTLFEGTINGDLYTEHVDLIDPEMSRTVRYFINTASTDKADLGYFKNSFNARFKDTKAYYEAEFEGVTVLRGTLTKPINAGEGLKGRKTVGCWIAAYDEKVISFEAWFPSGAILQTRDITIRNTETQRIAERSVLTAISSEVKSFNELSNRKDTHAKRHGHCRLTEDQERTVLAALQAGQKQKWIAEQVNLTPQAISKMKKRFIEEGLL